ncbi:hypothetical protein BZA77DRAFT_311391 [Pyronema omphalodes]|nr:hypothetical protein BZA77DRAFT_311391 [Pyronema omphalodes]
MSQKPAPGAQPKNMSNRLLTMKFMQRAVHSNPSTSKAEASKIAAATAEEAARRTAALHQRPRPTAGSAAIDNDEETEWVLSYVRPVVPEQKYVDNVGYSEMFASNSEDSDSDSDSEEEEETGGNATKKEGGRMVFGNFRKKNLEDEKKKSSKGDGEFDSDEELSSDEEGEEKERDRKPVIKQVSLRGLTSISNSGNAAALSQMKCHKCNEKGHKASSCTKDVECFNCGKRGHMAGDCEEKRRGKRKEVEDRRDSMPKRGRPSM